MKQPCWMCDVKIGEVVGLANYSGLCVACGAQGAPERLEGIKVYSPDKLHHYFNLLTPFNCPGCGLRVEAINPFCSDPGRNADYVGGIVANDDDL